MSKNSRPRLGPDPRGADLLTGTGEGTERYEKLPPPVPPVGRGSVFASPPTEEECVRLMNRRLMSS